MGDDKKSSRASRVLRFTLTSALAMAPLGGCGSSSVEPEAPNVNAAPVEEPPQPQAQPRQVPEPTDAVDSGIVLRDLIIES